MKKQLLALLLLSAMSTGVALADQGAVKVYVHKDDEAAKQEKAVKSDYIDYESEKSQPAAGSLVNTYYPYRAADGGLMFNVMPMQTRWEYGL